MTRRQDRAERLCVVAAKRKPESLEKYAPMLAPLEPANDDDPQGDEAWRDAIAEANSGTEPLNRRNT